MPTSTKFGYLGIVLILSLRGILCVKAKGSGVKAEIEKLQLLNQGALVSETPGVVAIRDRMTLRDGPPLFQNMAGKRTSRRFSSSPSPGSLSSYSDHLSSSLYCSPSPVQSRNQGSQSLL